jgi:hypothetical protein
MPYSNKHESQLCYLTVHTFMSVNRCTCVVMVIINEFMIICVHLNKSFNDIFPFIVFTGFQSIKLININLSVRAQIVIAT